jgi:Na+-transporting NADH:ubiquinone oxidoreductase subunit NqrE
VRLLNLAFATRQRIEAIIVWLVSWFILNQQWRTKAVDLAKVNVVAFIGLAIGLLLTFPPFMDLLQGK